jgi:hypothetical protein
MMSRKVTPRLLLVPGATTRCHALARLRPPGGTRRQCRLTTVTYSAKGVTIEERGDTPAEERAKRDASACPDGGVDDPHATYHSPWLGIDAQGSFFSSAWPFCRSSTE